MSASKPAPVDPSDDLDDLDDILDEFDGAQKPTGAASSAVKDGVEGAGPGDVATAAFSGGPPATFSQQAPAEGAAAVASTGASEGQETEEEMNEKFARELATGMEALMKGMGPEGGEAGSAAPAPSAGTGNENGEGLFNEEEMMKQFEAMMADMGLGGLGGMEGLAGAGGGAPGPGPQPSSSTSSGQSAPPPPPANFQDAIKSTMSRLRESDASASSSTGAGADGMDLEKLMAALGNGEGMEGEEGIAKMLESMMGELMSRDVLYEPLKELKDKYPGYLANPPKPLSSEDRARYESQYRIVTQVMTVFDDKKFETGTEVERTALKAKVQTLMNEMQDNGAPPAEIVGDLPPGLENMPGLGGDENCLVM